MNIILLKAENDISVSRYQVFAFSPMKICTGIVMIKLNKLISLQPLSTFKM